MKARFKNPPINEVIIGIYFKSPLTAFRSEHIGLLWSRLREDFPKVEQRPPIKRPPIISAVQGQNPALTIGGEVSVMPRYWFISEDEVTVLQVQKDAFLLNWRRRNSEYPHFEENLKPSFDKYYDIFKTFLKDDVGAEHPGIDRCELAYIDIIEPSEYWQNPLDTSDFIQSFSIPECASAPDAVPAFDCTYRYNIESNLQLHVALQTVETVDQPGSPCLFLEFRALGPPNNGVKSDVGTWYDRAHDAIVTQFLSMTSERAQREFWIFEKTE